MSFNSAENTKSCGVQKRCKTLLRHCYGYVDHICTWPHNQILRSIGVVWRALTGPTSILGPLRRCLLWILNPTKCVNCEPTISLLFIILVCLLNNNLWFRDTLRSLRVCGDWCFEVVNRKLIAPELSKRGSGLTSSLRQSSDADISKLLLTYAICYISVCQNVCFRLYYRRVLPCSSSNLMIPGYC